MKRSVALEMSPVTELLELCMNCVEALETLRETNRNKKKPFIIVELIKEKAAKTE